MRLPIGLVLAVVIGTALAVATGGTIAYLSAVAGDSARMLIADKGRLTRDRVLALVAGEMQRAADLAAALAAAVAEDRRHGDALDADRFAALARPLLDAVPVATGALYRGADGATLAYDRGNDAVTAGIGLAAAPTEGWAAPLRMPAGGPLGLPFVRPIPAGAVAVPLDLDRLSAALAAAAGDESYAAFLLDGAGAILAHSDPAVAPGTALDAPGGDPVPGLIARPSPASRPIPGLDHAFLDRRDGPMYAVFFRPLAAGTPPLIAGVHYRADALGAPGDEIDLALIVSGLLLVLVMAGAFLLGHRIGRPIRRLAGVAKRMETLAVQDAPRLPRSRLREIDDANQAVNAAIGGLGAFARDVPRDLVLRLLKPDAIGAFQSTTREVTVLFTDIAGYTAAASKMAAAEIATFLNHHFELLTACVEDSGGTVDKFIGDSLMAFWGAPQPQPDHAARAAAACRAMAAAFRADPVMRAAGVRLRIGLHSGTVMVGNVGARSRTSYTVIGDAVNVAARLEQLGKTIDPNADVIALTSAETAARLPADARGAPAGRHRLRGRDAETDLVRLV
ncbi:MAG: adenylate/guanylate cyclase domain-containing protein [Alphaproteobacteria bacterium]